MAGLGQKRDREWQELRLRDGRVFGLATYGDPSGTPVLALHGAPASRRMFDVADEIARARGLHLYCPDRPGYGLSPADEQPSLARRAEQLEAILDHLGLERIALCAVSGGAPYAVALASRLGQRVTAMALVSPMGPIADMERAGCSKAATLARSVSRGKRWFFMELPKRRAVVSAGAKIAAQGFFVAPKLFVRLFASLLSGADRKILSRPQYKASLIRMTREALRQGIVGGLADLEIYSRPWKVDFAAVSAPTVLWQGTDDRIVPVEAALWLNAKMPNCTLELIEGAGHFWIYENADAVLARLSRLIETGA